MLPSCGRAVKNLLPKDKIKKDDDWWRSVKIDIRDGLIATELTPPQFIQERRALVIPDGLDAFTRGQDQEWARVLGIGSAPTQKSSGNAPVQIDAPKDGADIKGIVDIKGKADSDAFVAYRVEFGFGTQPLEWKLISRSEQRQPGGGLAVWNTDGLANGTYTVRLVIEDADRGELSTFITVMIGKAPEATPFGGKSPTPKPTGTPDAPGNGNGNH